MKCTRICVEGGWKNVLKTTLNTLNRYLNLDLSVISSLVYSKSIVLDSGHQSYNLVGPGKIRKNKNDFFKRRVNNFKMNLVI
uniref:(California timema) hypothetical protein n=1 Tax=Timema californicum TaxID=61474 RepID=A0A7R9JHT2_TIMCA|nr:unnamed protein product [Timema californicum]